MLKFPSIDKAHYWTVHLLFSSYSAGMEKMQNPGMDAEVDANRYRRQPNNRQLIWDFIFLNASTPSVDNKADIDTKMYSHFPWIKIEFNYTFELSEVWANATTTTENYHNKRMDQIHDENEAQKLQFKLKMRQHKITKIFHIWIAYSHIRPKTDYIISN